MRVFEDQEMTANMIANTVLLSAGLGDATTYHVISVNISVFLYCSSEGRQNLWCY